MSNGRNPAEEGIPFVLERAHFPGRAGSATGKPADSSSGRRKWPRQQERRVLCRSPYDTQDRSGLFVLPKSYASIPIRSCTGRPIFGPYDTRDRPTFSSRRTEPAYECGVLAGWAAEPSSTSWAPRLACSL